MVAPAHRVDLWRAAKFAHHHHERFVEQTACLHVGDERRERLIELRAQHIAHPPGVIGVRVPQRAALHFRFAFARPVDLHEPHAGLHEPTPEQHALAEFVAAVIVPQRARLRFQIERPPARFGMQHFERLLVHVAQLGDRAAFRACAKMRVHLPEQAEPLREPRARHAIGEAQALDAHRLFRRVALHHHGMPRRPHEPAVLPRPHDIPVVRQMLRQHDGRKRRALARLQRAHDRSNARPIVGARRDVLRLRLRHVAREHERAARGVRIDIRRHRAHHRQPVRHQRRVRQRLGEMDARNPRRDRAKSPANLQRRIRLRVERLVLRRPPAEEDDHTRLRPAKARAFPRSRSTCASAEQMRQRNPQRAQPAHAQPFATRKAAGVYRSGR